MGLCNYVNALLSSLLQSDLHLHDGVLAMLMIVVAFAKVRSCVGCPGLLETNFTESAVGLRAVHEPHLTTCLKQIQETLLEKIEAAKHVLRILKSPCASHDICGKSPQRSTWDGPKIDRCQVFD